MFKNLKWSLKSIYIATRSGRNLRILPDDAFIVSYPKSGNTWVRFLVANLLNEGQEITFANIDRKMPDIYNNFRFSSKSLILKSHEFYDPRYRRVIYIVRDPRDVVLSYYHYFLKINAFHHTYPLSEFVDQFLNGELDNFGNWKENVGSWIGSRMGDGDFLLLRYEDILTSPTDKLSEIAKFLGISVSRDQISIAVDESSFERMQSIENETGHKWGSLKNSHPDRKFVRSGTAEQWRVDLSVQDVKKISGRWGELMFKLGYQS
jgi:hypothetical protein